MDASPKLLLEALPLVLQSKLVPYISGSPGIGKSEIVKQVADSFNLQLIDVRLSQLDSVDLLGFPMVKGDKTIFVPPEVFPISTDPLPKDKHGWLLFLDELSSASMSTQAAAYKLILDKKVGQHNLHSNVAIVAAGNKATDKAIVNKLGTAMQTRLVHFELSVKLTDWLEWAHTNKIDSRIISFIEFRPELLQNFDPNHRDNTFPCPRTWEFASKLLSGVDKLKNVHLLSIAGTVGEGAAREFRGFTDIYDNLPKFTEILAKPDSIAIPTKPDVLYALTGLIAFNVKKQVIQQVMVFVKRLPLEFQIITWISALRYDRNLLDSPELKQWVKDNALEVQP